MVRKHFASVLCAVTAALLLLSSCADGTADVDGNITPEASEPPADAVSTDITDSEKEENSVVSTDCLVPSAEAKKWIAAYELKFGAGSSEKKILDVDEIKKINADMVALADYMVDVRDFGIVKDFVTKNNLREWVSAGLPYDPCYKADGAKYTDTEIDNIYANRNIEKVGEYGPSRGIITERADLRTVPHGDFVLKAPDNMPYDRIQETELVVGMPVWILHESADGAYYFVQSYYYRGWVKTSAVAKVDNDADWSYFTEPENFVVVTDKLLAVNGKYVDMGVTLPIEEKTDRGYRVSLPGIDRQGNLTRESVFIEDSSAYEGYVPYTMANFYTQAFKYIGTLYGWGGMDNGVDCSSFVCSVMRSFGFEMPRNTSQQNKIMCSPITLSALSDEEKKQLFEELDAPAALFSSGHVTMVLGEIDGKYYIIHAPSAGKEICTAEITVTDPKYTYIAIMKGN